MYYFSFGLLCVRQLCKKKLSINLYQPSGQIFSQTCISTSSPGQSSSSPSSSLAPPSKDAVVCLIEEDPDAPLPSLAGFVTQLLLRVLFPFWPQSARQGSHSSQGVLDMTDLMRLRFHDKYIVPNVKKNHIWCRFKF